MGGSCVTQGQLKDSIAVRVHWQHVWGHAMCLRNDDRCGLQLPDLGVVSIRHQGPKPTPLLVAVMDQGKANKNGRVEVAAALRHKSDPFQCTHFALARMWHHRWVVQKGKTPSLIPHDRGPNQNPRRGWFDEYVNPGLTRQHVTIPSTKITYPTCLKEAKLALNGIPTPVRNVKCYTHIERKSSPGLAELEDIPVEQIRRAGRWRESGALLESYLTGIPYDFVRNVAGFDHKGSVYVLRADVVPSPAMVAQVFPFVKKLKAQQARTEAQRGWRWSEEDTQFVTLMDHLATVFIQDVAMVYEDCAGQPFLAHAPFNSFAFQEFRKELFVKMQDIPQQTCLETAESLQERCAVARQKTHMSALLT